MTKISFKIPKIILTDDFSKRANYLCYLAQKVSRGSYQTNNFLVLPYSSNITHTVFFPDFPYPKRFWWNVKRAGDIPVDEIFPRIASDLVKKLMLKTNLYKKKMDLDEVLHKYQKIFWNELNQRNILNREINRINKIMVLLTEYGPRTSFNIIPINNKKLNIVITFRLDRPNSDLWRNLIYSLVLVKNGKPGSSTERWAETRALVKFILEETKIKNLARSQTKELPATKETEKENKVFLEKLGFGKRNKLKIKDNNIYLDDKKISLKLSPSEELILRELILLKGKTLTCDQIAEILWHKKAEEKFSLWAIAKLMEKLRSKIRISGASHYLITTIYGQGYRIY